MVARAATGDPGAFADMVRYYDRRLRALAWRLLGDQAAMDDVLQEVYVKAYRALPRFHHGSSPGTWLHRITYNACIDEVRRRARRPHQPYDEQLAVEAHAGAGPEAVVADRAALAQALGRLPADQRAAVILVDAEGFDYRSAAEVLGVAAGTVASRLSRARAALRAVLDGRAEEDGRR